MVSKRDKIQHAFQPKIKKISDHQKSLNVPKIKGFSGAPKKIRTPNNRSEVDCDIHFTMRANLTFL